ncbi:unnamed protein product [Adineta steineri]|uniref:Uncharacterized protein n=1 Tax=Adineta steineri TaxID=433720 RepID=A0A814K3K6_9BILA|nr:unnamed protein product [Adineta steineri]CAF1045709.1 unnamed protein product [Adineta steineri]
MLLCNEQEEQYILGRCQLCADNFDNNVIENTTNPTKRIQWFQNKLDKINIEFPQDTRGIYQLIQDEIFLKDSGRRYLTFIYGGFSHEQMMILLWCWNTDSFITYVRHHPYSYYHLFPTLSVSPLFHYSFLLNYRNNDSLAQKPVIYAKRFIDHSFGDFLIMFKERQTPPDPDVPSNEAHFERISFKQLVRQGTNLSKELKREAQ